MGDTRFLSVLAASSGPLIQRTENVCGTLYHIPVNTASFQICQAGVEHLADIQSCAKLAYAKYVTRMGCKPAPMIADFASQIALGQVFIALSEASVVGYVVFYRKTDHLHLENVAVSPEHAGKGLGKALIATAERAAVSDGLNAVELYTNEHMTENLSMYPKLGYTEIGRRRQDGFNRVFFKKVVG